MRINERTQVLIELVIGFLAVILILIYTTRIFLWVNNYMVKQQVLYDKSRADEEFTTDTEGFHGAASYATEGKGEPVLVNEKKLPYLDIFNEMNTFSD